MAIEFRDVSAPPLAGFTATAPAGAIIGLIGEKTSGVSELLKLAAGVTQPEKGEIVAGPERRFVALGEAINLAPAAVIVLDQALATQDALVRARTLTALDRLRRAGSTILIASHDERMLEALCDEVWWLDAGTLASKGDPRTTLERYRRFVAECQSLSPEDLEKVYVFARSLRKPRVLDAAIAVLEESEGGDGVV